MSRRKVRRFPPPIVSAREILDLMLDMGVHLRIEREPGLARLVSSDPQDVLEGDFMALVQSRAGDITHLLLEYAPYPSTLDFSFNVGPGGAYLTEQEAIPVGGDLYLREETFKIHRSGRKERVNG